MKLIITLTLVFSYSVFAQCEDPFNPGPGCGMNNGQATPTVAILCSNGTVVQNDGTTTDSEGNAMTNSTVSGGSIKEASKATQVCRKHGGVAAYVDGAGAITVSVTPNMNILTDVPVNSGASASSSGSSAATEAAAVETPLGDVLVDLPNWAGDGGVVWIPSDSGSTGTTGAVTTGGLGLTKDELLSLSNEELAQYATTTMVGDCKVSDATSCGSCACDYYNRIWVPDPNTGYPHGTGCSDQVYMCAPYGCCESTQLANAGCIVRRGLINGDCGLGTGGGSVGTLAVGTCNINLNASFPLTASTCSTCKMEFFDDNGTIKHFYDDWGFVGNDYIRSMYVSGNNILIEWGGSYSVELRMTSTPGRFDYYYNGSPNGYIDVSGNSSGTCNL